MPGPGGGPAPPLRESPPRHRDDLFSRRCPPPHSGRPCPLPHPRPPRHRLLHALVHCPQSKSDSQLGRHAASSPHPKGGASRPRPRHPGAEDTFRSSPTYVSGWPNQRSRSNRLTQWTLSAAGAGRGGVAEAPPLGDRHLGEVAMVTQGAGPSRRRASAAGEPSKTCLLVRCCPRPSGTLWKQNRRPAPFQNASHSPSPPWEEL